eukprot:UN23235
MVNMLLFYVTENNDIHDKSVLTIPDVIPANKRHDLFVQTREGLELDIIYKHSLSTCMKVWEMFVVAFRNDHVVWSLFARDRGSNLSNRYRVLAFAIYLFNVMLGSAIFYAQNQEHAMSEIYWSFVVSLCSSFPVWLFKWAARATRPKFDAAQKTDSVMERFQSHREGEVSHSEEGEPNHPVLTNAV